MVMRKKTWTKDLRREVKNSWPRFVSILVIVLLGVAFFAGIKATAPDMRNTADKYFDDYTLMDIRVLSTLGLTQDDIEAIRSAETVESVVPAYFTDAVCTVNSTEFVFRMHSLQKGGQTVNGLRVTEGRLPEKPGECLVEDSKNLNIGLKIGDTLQVGSGKETPIVGDVLKRDTFTIVGKAVTPYYLSFDKGASDIGNGKVTFFMMIPEEDFAYPVYTEALITLRGAKELICYDQAYKDLVARTSAVLENMGVDRSGIRLNEIKGQAEAQLNAAKTEYESKKKEFDDKTASAAEKLEQSRIELNRAEATLASEKENFRRTGEQAKEQIASAKIELAEEEKQYQKGLRQYNESRAKYSSSLAELNSAVQQMNGLSSTAAAAVGDMKKQLDDPSISQEERDRLTNLIALYGQFQSRAKESVNTANDMNNFARSQMANAASSLKQVRNKLDAGYKAVADAEKQLAESEKVANEKFAQADKDIADGWKQYYEGKTEFEKAKKQGGEELAAGQEKIIKAEDEIDRISKPQWYVLGRDTNLSYADFDMTASRIDAIASAFPVFFFLVAALVCLTTMTRMVDEQRGTIGIYKALGYSDRTIALKYVLYAMAASALGAAAGLASGVTIFPEVIYRSWLMKYEMPALQPVAQAPLLAVSFLMGLLVTTVTAWAACRRELLDAPARLMRPKAPKPGRRIFLERIAFLWKRFSFSQKVTARNLFRYKKRFFMTVTGIAGCTALLLAGFGLSNSIGRVVDKQFKQIFSYNIDLRYKADAGEEAKKRLEGLLSGDPAASSWLRCAELNAKARTTGDDLAATLVVPSDAEAFKAYVSLRSSATGQMASLGGEGAVISEKLAKELGVGRGDTIEMDNGMGVRKKVVVADIAENYVFHYIYMSADYYKSIFRLDAGDNCLMIRLKEDSANAEDALAHKLIEDGSVASATFYSALAGTFRQTVKSLDDVILVIILCAGLLAFVVLYNLTNINISERIREIATVKVLGFTNREVSAYVFRENVCLAVIGVLIGLPLGVLLHGYIMTTLEQPGIMFGHFIHGLSYLWSVLITAGFTGAVILVMGFKLRKIPMVESLKSVE